MTQRNNSELEFLINDMTREELLAAEQTFTQLLNSIRHRLVDPPTLIVLKLPPQPDGLSRWQQN